LTLKNRSLCIEERCIIISLPDQPCLTFLYFSVCDGLQKTAPFRRRPLTFATIFPLTGSDVGLCWHARAAHAHSNPWVIRLKAKPRLKGALRDLNFCLL
jgi:hypothetical protein